MMNQHLVMSVGLPVPAILTGVSVNGMRFVALKFDIPTGKVIRIDNRLNRVEEQLKHLH